jgi:hypothetical protein
MSQLRHGHPPRSTRHAVERALVERVARELAGVPSRCARGCSTMTRLALLPRHQQTDWTPARQRTLCGGRCDDRHIDIRVSASCAVWRLGTVTEQEANALGIDDAVTFQVGKWRYGSGDAHGCHGRLLRWVATLRRCTGKVRCSTRRALEGRFLFGPLFFVRLLAVVRQTQDSHQRERVRQHLPARCAKE